MASSNVAITGLLDQLIKITNEIFANRYSSARVIFLAGSLVRDEGTPYSDLDLVVIFDSLTAAYRESFYFQGFPVEAFVHDRETLNYFLSEIDYRSGIPALAQMILEGIEIPKPNEFSQSLKRLAALVLGSGPPALSAQDIQRMRYNITNLIDDIRQFKSKDELVAAGTALYESLADFYLRTNNHWSAKGKSIPGILKRQNPDLGSLYCNSFEELFERGIPEKVIALAEEVLKPKGGFLFDGYKLNAPADCRKPMDLAAEQTLGADSP
jgi:predicted nucleotidyltransferase